MFQMINTNASFFVPATVYLSTVKLPSNRGYESCLFTGDDSAVLERYDDVSSAVKGHVMLSLQHQLSTRDYVEI